MLSYKFQTSKISFRFQSVISHCCQSKQVFMLLEKTYENHFNFIARKCNLKHKE